MPPGRPGTRHSRPGTQPLRPHARPKSSAGRPAAHERSGDHDVWATVDLVAPAGPAARSGAVGCRSDPGCLGNRHTSAALHSKRNSYRLPDWKTICWQGQQPSVCSWISQAGKLFDPALKGRYPPRCAAPKFSSDCGRTNSVSPYVPDRRSRVTPAARSTASPRSPAVRGTRGCHRPLRTRAGKAVQQVRRAPGRLDVGGQFHVDVVERALELISSADELHGRTESHR